jgi:hypothetical protein
MLILRVSRVCSGTHVTNVSRFVEVYTCYVVLRERRNGAWCELTQRMDISSDVCPHCE